MAQIEVNHEENLKQFTGTEDYHRIQPLARTCLGTDGVFYVANEMKAHWLISDIMIVISMKFRRIPFQIWEFKRLSDGTGLLTMREDTGKRAKYTQRYGWTDFPTDNIKFYAVHGGLDPEGPIMNILMLTTEY